MSVIENIAGAALVGGTLILSPLLRGRYNRWGASDAELHRTLPGDELVPDPKIGYTHAINIAAPPEKVWPWIVQIGQGRGGFYSYEGLENLAGCRIHNTENILSEHQNPQIWDLIRLGPKGYPCFAIAAIEPPSALILVGADPKTGLPPDPLQKIDKGYSNATWQFVLEPLVAASTRLIIRQRLDFSPDTRLIWRITEPIAFVMERKMLLGIRERVENGRSA